MLQKCSCSHCSGHIEFDSEHAGQVVACPHCGFETKLCVPKGALGKPLPNTSGGIKRGVSVLGVVSLVFGTSACVFCWIPSAGPFAFLIAGVGFLLAVIAITAAVVGKRSSLSFPVIGAGVCIIAILIMLFVNDGISRLSVKNENQSNFPKQPSTPVAVLASSPTPTTSQLDAGAIVATSASANLATAKVPKSEPPISQDAWSKSRVAQQGAVKITINAAQINASVNPSGNLIKSDLSIVVSIENLSSSKILSYRGWSGGGNAVLTDNYDNIYVKERDRVPPIGDYQIYPGKTIGDFLSFAKPVENIAWLHLELPATNFGGNGVLRFEIPASTIKIQRW